MSGEPRREAVPAGNKMTEVGVIPEDWEVYAIGTEFRIELGKMLDGQKNVGRSVPYVGNKAVQWKNIDVEAIGIIRIPREELSRYRLEPGDLLVCEGGEIGRASLWHGEIEECYYQKAVHRLRSIGHIDSEYLLHLLEQWGQTGYLLNEIGQTSIAHLPKEKLERVRMAAPPLPEQRAIAEALSDVDNLLDALDRLIAKKRAVKQAVMQQLLTGKTRLPGFAGEWEETTLGDKVSFLSGGTPPKGDDTFWTGPVPWISASTLKKTEVSDSDQHVTTGAAVRYSQMAPLDSTLVLVRGSALYHHFRAGLVVKPVAFNQDIKALIPDESLFPRFLTYALLAQSNELLGMVTSATNSAGVLDTKVLKALEIFVPPLPEQRAIAEVLSDMDDEIAALEKRRDKTRHIKEGMMQQLLTGRVRLLKSGEKEWERN